MTNPRSLSAAWRAQADVLRRYGAEATATALVRCSEDLDAWFREYEMESLSVGEAAQETGYSVGHIRNLLSKGELANVGRKGRPKVLRRDVLAHRARGK